MQVCTMLQEEVGYLELVLYIQPTETHTSFFDSSFPKLCSVSRVVRRCSRRSDKPKNRGFSN